METKYLTCAETAVLVRKALKAAFPGVKFSVKSSTYSMGAHVSVRWLDGPGVSAVEEVCHQYEGSDFDGSIDLKSYREHWLLPDGRVAVARVEGTEGSMGQIPGYKRGQPHPEAVRVSFGADSVECSRSLSADYLRRVAAKVAHHWGVPPPKVREDGYVDRNGPSLRNGYHDTIGDLVLREAYDADASRY